MTTMPWARIAQCITRALCTCTHCSGRTLARPYSKVLHSINHPEGKICLGKDASKAAPTPDDGSAEAEDRHREASPAANLPTGFPGMASGESSSACGPENLTPRIQSSFPLADGNSGGSHAVRHGLIPYAMVWSPPRYPNAVLSSHSVLLQSRSGPTRAARGRQCRAALLSDG
jgi:hypothetical protein